MRLTGLAHGHGAIYRQLKKVFLNLLSGVLESHQSWLEVYKPVSLPCVLPVLTMRLGQRSESCLAQAPGLQSPADASNFDAGPEQIRISTSSISGVPAGQPL